jgi:hypothetical protein
MARRRFVCRPLISEKAASEFCLAVVRLGVDG